MKLITKKMMIKDIARRLLVQYPFGMFKDKDACYEKLIKLPENATEADVVNIVGNKSWTSIKCKECIKECDAAVMLRDDAEDPDVFICQECLEKAMDLFGMICI